MKKLIYTSLLLLLILSCSKKKEDPNTLEVVEKLKNTWKIKSETRTGAINERYTPSFANNTITFGSDGKARSNLEGQTGLVYDYNFVPATGQMNYKFILFLPPYHSSNIQTAYVSFISDSLLVLSNTFKATINGTESTLNLVDSLTR